ncbi:hypothetical protein Tco_0675185 [Tanacetum coccineum]
MIPITTSFYFTHLLKPQKTQKPKKPKRKDTQVPQPSDPIENVVDEAVHKELGDSLVRAATTASRSSGPRCQDTIGDTIAQTRFENVESSRDEESLGEDASKQGRVNAIDADNDITLVSVQDDADKEMFNVNALDGEEVFVAGQNENVVEEMVDGAQVSTAATNVTITTEEITLAQALEALKTSKPKDKGKEWDDIQAKIDVDHQLAERLQAQEQEELSVEEKATLFQQLLEKRRKHFAAKRAEEKRNKPPTKAQQRKIMCTYLKNMEGYKLNDLKLKEFDSIQEMFDRAFKRVNTFEDFRTELVEGKEKRAGTELAQEITKKQKVEDDKETAEIKKLMEIIPDEEEVAIDAIPLAVNHMLKSFDREDLETLYKLVKAKYESTRPVEDLDLILCGDLKTIFEPHVEDKIYMLVEKKYPLTPSTLTMMLEKKLMIDYESEMAYQLLKFIIKQLKK